MMLKAVSVEMLDSRAYNVRSVVIYGGNEWVAKNWRLLRDLLWCVFQESLQDSEDQHKSSRILCTNCGGKS